MLPNRVLLADDDLEVRQGVADLLAPLGLEILHAEDGMEALRIALERLSTLALMVLDVHMPGCSGLEVLSRVRLESRPLSVPCIVCSGEATEGLQRQALDAGAWAFLRKPVQPDLLRSEVRRALESMRSARLAGGPPFSDQRP